MNRHAERLHRIADQLTHLHVEQLGDHPTAAQILACRHLAILEALDQVTHAIADQHGAAHHYRGHTTQ